MRLKSFLAISLLTTTVRACYFSPYIPEDTHLYRIMEDVSLYEYYPDVLNREYFYQNFDNKKENLQLWREQTGTKMSDERLEFVVYRMKPNNVSEFFYGQPEANCCLETAKNVQKIRDAMADPWYFPSSRGGGGPYVLCLEELVERCKREAHGVFRGRYVLQALRCLNTLRRWDESVEYWEKQRDTLSRDIIFTMAEREVAAAYRQIGNNGVAADIYARVGDMASLRMCRTNRDNEMEYIYERCPNSPYFPEEIQALLTYFNHICTGSKPYYSEFEEDDSLRATQFLALCQRVLREHKVKDLAMWNYATAATLDVLDRSKESMKYIRQGERLCKDDFLRKSFRLLRMHIEAKNLSMNHSYDQRLFRDLRWLCQQIDNNMNVAEKERLSKLTCYRWDNNPYYWNDAMRQILLVDVCPRMVKAGRTTRALQLANFADYYLFRKLGNRTIQHIKYAWNGIEYDWDDFSYCSNVFQFADSLSADQLATYVRWQMEGQGEFDQFLASGSNQDAVYWYDLVGTHYLRENMYSKAKHWLSHLPKDYEWGTNIYRQDKGYFLRDPFDLSIDDPNPRRSRLKTTTDYKLNYARKMAKYEHKMKYGKTADERGKAKVYYAAGLKNQWDYCWALTRYEDGENWWWTPGAGYCYEDGKPSPEGLRPHYDKVVEQAKKMIEEGLAEISDPELKARLLHAMHRNKEVMDKCPFTETARQLRLHCDTWRDYI